MKKQEVFEKEEIRCNKCGKTILLQNEIGEDFFHAEKAWGYFSKRDGKKHQWNLCEQCYQDLMDSFLIEAEESVITELL